MKKDNKRAKTNLLFKKKEENIRVREDEKISFYEKEEVTYSFYPLEEVADDLDFNLDEKNQSLILSVISSDLEALILDEELKVDSLETKLKVINKKQEDEYLKIELQELKEELEELFKELKSLRARIENLGSISFKDLKDFNDLDISFFITKLNEANKLDDKFIKDLKAHIILIEDLIELEEDALELEEVIDDKIDDLGLRDELVEEISDNLKFNQDDLKEVQSKALEIDELLRNLEKSLELDIKVNEEIERTKKVVVNTTALIQAVALYSIGKRFKSSLLSVAFKAMAIVKLTKVFKTEEKEKKITTIHDDTLSLEKYLDKGEKLLYISDNLLDKALSSIEEIKDSFDADQNIKELAEYKELFDSIITMENNLIKEKNKLDKYLSDLQVKKDDNIKRKNYIKDLEK